LSSCPDADHSIETQAGGYSLQMGAARTDVDDVKDLIGRGREQLLDKPEESLRLFRSALGLWRGQPLAEFSDTPFAGPSRAWLEQLRDSVVDDRFAAELACGNHAECLPELEASCATHPTREQRWALRILALYRAGRQADALAAYRKLQHQLDEELGLQPGRELRDLQSAILAQSPALDLGQGAAAAVPAMTRSLLTIAFTDIVGSTKLLARLGDDAYRLMLRDHHARVRDLLGQHAGLELNTTGDGLMVAFESPGAAIAWAGAVMAKIADLDLQLRIGMHAGECDVAGPITSGIAVHIAARVVAVAGANEIVITGTVRELVSGSGVETRALGERSLAGIPGRWSLHVVVTDTVTGDAGQPADARPRLLLVDDHPLWRETLAGTLEHRANVNIVAEAGDGLAAVSLAIKHAPDVVIMDIGIPELDGIEATRRITNQLPNTRVLVLSSSEDPAQVTAAVRAGAAGYLLKTTGGEQIADAVRRIQEGDFVFPPALASIIFNELRSRDTES